MMFATIVVGLFVPRQPVALLESLQLHDTAGRFISRTCCQLVSDAPPYPGEHCQMSKLRGDTCGGYMGGLDILTDIAPGSSKIELGAPVFWTRNRES